MLLNYQKSFSLNYSKSIKKSIYRRNVCCKNSVNYEYFDLYSKFVCKNELPSCIENMVLPEPSEQIKIIQKLFDITTKLYDMYGLEGVFLKLIIMDDQNAIQLLIDNINNYSQSKNVINSIVEYSNSIPLGLFSNNF